MPYAGAKAHLCQARSNMGAACVFSERKTTGFLVDFVCGFAQDNVPNDHHLQEASWATCQTWTPILERRGWGGSHEQLCEYPAAPTLWLGAVVF